MLDSIFILVFISILFEYIEVQWQRTSSFYLLIERNYSLYQKGFFRYISHFPSFFLVLALLFIVGHINFIMTIVVGMKFFDILLRLYFISALDRGRTLESIIPVDMPISNSMLYFGVFFYPTMIYLSF
jgi:hypothetical protein